MRPTIYTILINIMLINVLVTDIKAQSATSSITYTVENVDSSNYNYRRQYQYLDFAKVNEKNLLKFGFSALKYNYNFFIGYERKLTKSLSVLIDLTNERSEPDTRIGFRYFFLMKNRMQQGLSGNNLSGVYLSSKINLNHFQDEKNSDFVLADISLGLQKRLNWFSYIDVSVFFGTVDTKYLENYGYVFGFSGKLGLAWGW